MPVNLGERQPGILEVLPICLVLLAAGFAIQSRGRILAPLLSRQFLIIWAPFLALSFVLPVFGVLIGQYPLRGLAAVRTPVIAVSALVLGAELRANGGFGVRRWGALLAIAAVAQASYSVVEQVLAGHLLPAGPWYALFRWDIATQLAYGRAVVVGRSSGFYSNPNILGAWAGIALLIGLFVAGRRYRYGIVAAALAALVLSQSRGAILGLAASLVGLLILALREADIPRLRVLRAYGTIAAAVFVGWVLLTAAGAPTGDLVARLAQGVGVLLGGPDANWAGRIRFWQSGLALLASHPLGTYGPPEVLLGTAVDSEWVRTLLQGGLLLFFSLGLALVGGALITGPESPERRVLRVTSLFIAVAGIAQIPLEYPPAVLYWALVGAFLAVPAAARVKQAAEDPLGRARA